MDADARTTNDAALLADAASGADAALLADAASGADAAPLADASFGADVAPLADAAATCEAHVSVGSRQLDAVIRASPGAVDLPVSDLIVTLVKPEASGEAGFFVQSERGGPAVFVLASATSTVPLAGDRVSFRVTQKRIESFSSQVAALDGWQTHARGVDLEPLRLDVTMAADLASAVQVYESTLVRAEVTIQGDWVNAARGHLRAAVHTRGGTSTTGPELAVRLLAPPFDPAAYPVGCTFDLDGIVWRYGDQVQLSTYRAEDIGACRTLTNTVAPPVPVPCESTLIPVPRVGSEDTLDIATWNLEAYPKSPDTPALAGQAIIDMDIDLVGLQELGLRPEFDRLLAALPGYEGIRSHEPAVRPDNFYLVRAFVYKTSVLTLVEQQLLRPNDPLFTGILMARFEVQRAGALHEITVLVVHNKAGSMEADFSQRAAQTVAIEAEVRALVEAGHAMVMVLGDFNQDPSEPRGPEVWQPLITDPTRYALLTAPLVPLDASHVSGRFLDHIVATRSLADVIGPRPPVVAHLERAHTGYLGNYSDHLPVIVSVPLR